MKKFLMIAVMAVAALSANAQVWIGGDLSFSSDKANKDAESTTTFGITPEIGYSINDKWAVAIDLGYITSNKGENGVKLDETSTAFEIAPFARYNACKSGNFTFFLDGGVSYTTYNHDGGNIFTVGVRPGIAFNPTEKISLVAHTGWLGYSKNSDERGGGSSFGLNLANTALSFGVYYNF